MLVFSVYIPFLISRVRPVHSIFEKKSILENPSQIFTNLFFHAYMAYMPSFFAWLFRPAFKDNKVISSFSTFLRLLLSFFDIPRIISQFSASLLLFLSVFSPSIFSCFLFNFFSCSLFFLSHLTFPAYLSLVSELLLFSFLFFSFLSLLQLFSISSLVLFSFSSHLISSLVLYFSCVLFFSFSSLSHLTFPAYLSLLFHYPLIDSVQCDKPLFLISVVPAVQFVRRNPPFSGQVIDFELLVRGIPPSAGQISVGASAHLCRIPTAGMA